ncbi:MAG: domain S-box protein [Conexibacter sp.]|nr:domain S-box protein [Conexibacter sp.]
MTCFAARWRSAPDPAKMPDEELVEAVVEELAEPVVAIGADGLVRSNRRARELHGLPRAPLSRDRWAARHRLFARGADRAFAPEELPLLRAMDGEEVAPVEVEIRDRKGAPERFVVSAHPIRRGRRGVIGALSILRPQSRREQGSGFPSAEVLQHAADGIAVICAVTGTFIYTNDAWSHALGYEPGELTGRHVSSVNAPSDRLPQELAAEMLQVLERGGNWRGEVELRRRDGSTVWWEQTVSRYDDDLGRPAWIMVGRDVGARRSGAGELRAAEQRFRTAFDALPVAAALTDADGRLLAVNDELAGRAGVRREELLGRALDGVLEPVDPEHARAVGAAGRRGELSRYRVEARSGDSGEPVAVTTTIVRDVDGRPLHAVAVVEPVRPS